MARAREVGTLWIGGSLSWLEQLCLKSFVDQGQKITLFSYEDIPNVPKGVLRRDGREILDTDNFIKYEKKDSYALFADYFRIQMIRQCPGMIWVDTDVYCYRPMEYDGDYVLGYELHDSDRVNNAVLGLPVHSPILADLLDFMSDPFVIPPFLKPQLVEEYEAAKAAGTPVHVSQQPWGVWGPMMITHFVKKHGLKGKVQPVDAFYPVTFPERTLFMRAPAKVDAKLTERTTALHLWASNKREMGLRHGGLPPKGSFLDMLVKKHGIQPEKAILKGRGGRVFDAGLLDALPEGTRIDTLADLGGTSQSLALAVHARHDCSIVLIDVDHRGAFPETESKWVAPYLKFLAENGVAEDRVSVVRDAGALRSYDLVCNLSGFGDVNKVKWLEPFLTRCFHADSLMLMDIRKGSGSFPFLNEFGSCETISARDDGGVEIARILYRPNPPAASGADPDWARIARDLAGDDGFYRENDAHSFLFIPRNPEVLVVTFDNLDIAMNKREERRPWGFQLIEKQGWSMLGVMANGWTWYRDPWVFDEFDRLANEGFFNRFKRVVFYGASMGGYAACAFSAAHPGADVVAISPQSTVDKAVVPWETRYKVVWDKDFSGKYGDAASASAKARRVSILYDPYEPLDAGHADRFTSKNVVRLRAPLLGHRLGSSLNQMGILSPIILGALEGRLDETEFYRMLRARREFPRYQRELFERAVSRARPDLARRIGEWVLLRGDNRFIRLALKDL